MLTEIRSSCVCSSMPSDTSSVPSTPSTRAATSFAMAFSLSSSLPLISMETPLPPSADISIMEVSTLISQGRSAVSSKILAFNCSLVRSLSSFRIRYMVTCSVLELPMDIIPEEPAMAPTASTSVKVWIRVITSSETAAVSSSVLPFSVSSVTDIWVLSVFGIKEVPLESAATMLMTSMAKDATSTRARRFKIQTMLLL